MSTSRFNSSTIRALIVVAACTGWVHAAAADATSLGPDGPGWAVVEPNLPHPSESADEDQVRASADPLAAVRAKVSRAQDLAQSGHEPEALALVQEGVKDLDGYSPSRPGVASLREQLEQVRAACTRADRDDSSTPAAENTKKDGADRKSVV